MTIQMTIQKNETVRLKPYPSETTSAVFEQPGERRLMRRGGGGLAAQGVDKLLHVAALAFGLLRLFPGKLIVKLHFGAGFDLVAGSHKGLRQAVMGIRQPGISRNCLLI